MNGVVGEGSGQGALSLWSHGFSTARSFEGFAGGCSFSMAGSGRPNLASICLVEAVVHVWWYGDQHGYLCAMHAPKYLAVTTHEQVHPLGDFCGDPASRWSAELNECVIDGGSDPRLEGVPATPETIEAI